MLILVISAAAQDEIEKIETDLASFEVTVSDKNGNPVRNLTQDDFRVFENGVERPIDFFQPIKKQDEGRPLSVVFALDVSGSMTPAEIERLRQAMQNFIRRLADYNSYFAVMTFAMEVKTVQQFTNRPEVLEKSFDRLNRNQNGLSTHAYDAVDDAVRLIARKSPKTIKDRIPKRAVIVITDGFPVGDSVSPSTVIERANNAEASVFSVILPSYSRLQPDKRPVLTPLEASGLIDRTGGKSLYATDKNFEPLFASLAEEITSSYAIAFYPPENVRDAKPREVRIESKSGLIVRQNRRTYLLKK
jgi:VWFA-related protein